MFPPPAPQEYDAAMKEQMRYKLSPDTVEMLEYCTESKSLPPEPIRVLVQLTCPLTRATEHRLNNAGLAIQGRAGDVITARLAADKLESVAALDEVKYLQLAQPMFLEGV
jgi:hypothetical protein